MNPSHAHSHHCMAYGCSYNGPFGNHKRRCRMKAAVLRHTAPIELRPLMLENVPVPEPGPDEVLLRVKACGVCRTDLHITSGELPPLRSAVTPGHQIVGHVEKLGEGITDLSTGAR